MVATIKVIPFAVPGDMLDRGRGSLARRRRRRWRCIRSAPLTRRTGADRTAGLKESVTEGTIEATRARVTALGGTLLPPLRCPHATEADRRRAASHCWRQGAELLLVAGASATVDRRDVGPAGIVRGGRRDRCISACRSIRAT